MRREFDTEGSGGSTTRRSRQAQGMSTLVGVAALAHPDYLIEIEAIAVVG